MLFVSFYTKSVCVKALFTLCVYVFSWYINSDLVGTLNLIKCFIWNFLILNFFPLIERLSMSDFFQSVFLTYLNEI